MVHAQTLCTLTRHQTTALTALGRHCRGARWLGVICMDRVTIPLDFKPLELGRFTIEQEALVEVLGEPHYIETDGARTAGGHEWLWAFEDKNEVFAFLFRQPYKEVDIWTKHNHPREILKIASSLFERIEIEVYDKPYQHQ